jgi:hypothetical protein
VNKSHPSQYEIRVQGHLAPRRLACFEHIQVTHHPDGETSIVGAFQDQSALYGLLNHLYNLGITLLSVHRMAEPTGKGHPVTAPREDGQGNRSM